MSEENKALIRGYIEGMNQGNMAVLEEFMAPNHISHHGAIETNGAEEFIQFMSMVKTAFPDWEFTIEDQIAEGDKEVHRWTGRGTHQGEWMGVPPTGKEIEIMGIYVSQIVEGQIVEEWGLFDQFGLMQQLGAIPSPEKAEA
jgi:steroid delta-isomerase-like uncharacterized protein